MSDEAFQALATELGGTGTPVRWDELTWPEAGEASGRLNAALIPVGATEQHGPHLPLAVDTRICEAVALAVSALVTAACVVINYVIPGRAFGLLMGLAVSALVINWAMISIMKISPASPAKVLVIAFITSLLVFIVRAPLP